MYDWHRYTKLQRKLLVKVRTEGKDLPTAQAELNLSVARVMNWLRKARFRAALDRATNENLRYARLLNRQAYAAESRAIAEDRRAGKEITAERRANLESLHANVERDERLARLERQGRRSRKGKPKPAPSRDLLHPNAEPYRKELVAILSKPYEPEEGGDEKVTR